MFTLFSLAAVRLASDHLRRQPIRGKWMGFRWIPSSKGEGIFPKFPSNSRDSNHYSLSGKLVNPFFSMCVFLFFFLDVQPYLGFSPLFGEDVHIFDEHIFQWI